MRIAQLKINNFRGISNCNLLLPEHAVLVGGNNIGKSTILEAIDLVLGPERLYRRPAIDEHDFYAGIYLDNDGVSTEIKIEVIVIDLSDEQQRHFNSNIEWWDRSKNELIQSPPADQIESPDIIPALRVGFTGKYDKDEDDFTCETYFLSPPKEDGTYSKFKAKDKRICGFLFLRTLRTGSRALSLERGSLLDIILKLKDVKLQMWENVLEQLREISVATDPSLEISNTLSNVQDAIRTFVPSDWGTEPQLKVSDLTRENLRKVLTVFMGTGAKKADGSNHIAPFQHQGTGTINTLVLSMLSIIADLKHNVIFAMEEPEIAIPPHTQKRIVDSIRNKSSQAIFTSHSPYILEEFQPDQILVLTSSTDGLLSGTTASFPKAVKPKLYRSAMRKGYCEALLAKKVLITEGQTEYDAIPTAARRLHDLDSENYKTLEALGISILDAGTDSQIAPIAEKLKAIGKTTLAVCDKQDPTQLNLIKPFVDHLYESPAKSFEKLILDQTSDSALKRFALALVKDKEWPQHLSSDTPQDSSSIEDTKESLGKYFSWSKGAGTAADLLNSCSLDEIPAFVKETISSITQAAEESAPSSSQEESQDDATI